VERLSKSPYSPDSSPAPTSSRSVAQTLLSSSLLDAIPDAIVAVNQTGIIVQVNAQTEHMFGYTRVELIGQKVELLVPERQRQQHHHHREHYAGHPKVRQMGAGLELHGRRRDGSEFPVEISLSPVTTEGGILVLSAIRDISDRKRIEEQLLRAQQELNRRQERQLRDSENRLALIVDSSQDAIIGKNLDGIITHWNQGAERMYGYHADEVIGKSISILAPKDRQDEIPGILEKIRRGENVEYFESVRVTKSGQHLNVSISVSPIYDADGTIVGASAIARNVTAQKRTEEQLRQAQKMEAVGRLAGGVAHDFNNILGIIIACSELLRGRIDPDDGLLEYVNNIRKAADRGASLTKQLLSFSRRQPANPRLLDLNERLRDVINLLRPLMGDDIEISLRPRADSAIVEADPSQIDQIVLNLAVNARDAMPRGGKLIIETASQAFDEVFADRHRPLAPGKYAMLSVSDNGSGMDKDTVARIFEPFFTTKEAGKGTGLGLSTVYGIVKQSGGNIWVYSEPGRGTTFKIYLPSAEHKLEHLPRPEAEALPPRREGTAVLLVEDDSMMRAATRQMLEEHGYSVVEASDGGSALQVLSANHSDIKLALTDVIMQGMSGPDLAMRLIESHPAVKVVYMSGYTGQLLAEHDGMSSETVLLEKPFTRIALLKTLDEVLG